MNTLLSTLDTWDIVSIVLAGVIVLLLSFSLGLFLFLKKSKTGDGFEETLSVSLLTRNDIRPWFKKYEGADRTLCLCTAEAYARLGDKDAEALPEKSLVQFVCKGEEVIAARVVRYDEIDGGLAALIERGNGVCVIDAEGGEQ